MERGCHADALRVESAGQDEVPAKGAELGNLDLADRGPQGATPAMRAALLPALQQCLGRYSFKATADELQELQQKLQKG